MSALMRGPRLLGMSASLLRRMGSRPEPRAAGHQRQCTNPDLQTVQFPCHDRRNHALQPWRQDPGWRAKTYGAGQHSLRAASSSQARAWRMPWPGGASRKVGLAPNPHQVLGSQAVAFHASRMGGFRADGPGPRPFKPVDTTSGRIGRWDDKEGSCSTRRRMRPSNCRAGLRLAAKLIEDCCGIAL